MFIEFNESMYNVNHIIFYTNPRKHHLSANYIIRLIYGDGEDGVDVESFRTKDEANKRFAELNQILNNS
jgi:hypothetical protein